MDSSQETPEGASRADALTLAQWNWPPELQKNTYELLYTPKFLVILQHPRDSSAVHQGTRGLCVPQVCGRGRHSKRTGSNGLRLARRGEVQNSA